MDRAPVWSMKRGGRCNFLAAIEQLAESCLVDFATPDVGGGDLRLLGDHAGGKLLRRHLQREESNDAPSHRPNGAVDLLCRVIGACDVERDIGGE